MEHSLSVVWSSPGSPCPEGDSIRTHVFVDEQGYTPELEFDESDQSCWHLVTYQNGAPMATGRLIEGGNHSWHLGRIAVEKPLRGIGLGTFLVQCMIEKAADLGAEQLLLGAQCRARGFYEKLGFRVCGGEYMDGHVPHVPMCRSLP